MRRASLRRAVLLGAIMVSAAIGFGYAFLFALPTLRSAIADGSHLLPGSFALSAALGFAIAQLVAGLRVLRDRASFFAWLMPAALYLFAIGVIGWFRHGELQPLWLDSARGLLLIGLGYAHLRALRGAHSPP